MADSSKLPSSSERVRGSGVIVIDVTGERASLIDLGANPRGQSLSSEPTRNIAVDISRVD